MSLPSLFNHVTSEQVIQAFGSEGEAMNSLRRCIEASLQPISEAMLEAMAGRIPPSSSPHHLSPHHPSTHASWDPRPALPANSTGRSTISPHAPAPFPLVAPHAMPLAFAQASQTTATLHAEPHQQSESPTEPAASQPTTLAQQQIFSAPASAARTMVVAMPVQPQPARPQLPCQQQPHLAAAWRHGSTGLSNCWAAPQRAIAQHTVPICARGAVTQAPLQGPPLRGLPPPTWLSLAPAVAPAAVPKVPPKVQTVGGSSTAALVAKTLTNSDASSGRIILPRVAVAANLPFLAPYRTFALKLRDHKQQQWEFVIKSWANGAETKRVYVLEQTLGYLTMYSLAVGDVVGICASDEGELVVEFNTPAVKEAAKRPSYTAHSLKKLPPPSPGKTELLVLGGDSESKCERSPACTKMAGHTGFCSGRRLSAKEKELLRPPKSLSDASAVTQPASEAPQAPAASSTLSATHQPSAEEIVRALELPDLVTTASTEALLLTEADFPDAHVLFAKSIAAFESRLARIVLPGSVERLMPERARRATHMQLLVVDSETVTHTMSLHRWRGAQDQSLLVLYGAALNDLNLKEGDHFGICRQTRDGGTARFCLEINTENARQWAQQSAAAAAPAPINAGAAPLQPTMPHGSVIECTRTPNCIKQAGHQGFCSGHKGFKRRSCSLDDSAVEPPSSAAVPNKRPKPTAMKPMSAYTSMPQPEACAAPPGNAVQARFIGIGHGVAWGAPTTAPLPSISLPHQTVVPPAALVPQVSCPAAPLPQHSIQLGKPANAALFGAHNIVTSGSEMHEAPVQAVVGPCPLAGSAFDANISAAATHLSATHPAASAAQRDGLDSCSQDSVLAPSLEGCRSERLTRAAFLSSLAGSQLALTSMHQPVPGPAADPQHVQTFGAARSCSGANSSTSDLRGCNSHTIDDLADLFSVPSTDGLNAKHGGQMSLRLEDNERLPSVSHHEDAWADALHDIAFPGSPGVLDWHAFPS